ncbi:MAG: hypothetical protein N2692_00505 [Patescibacteria group bacterium]|jgi:predicted aconitase with swiveling domain|nr:hypothetical protein [Patescibacteria group bacterium]
MFKKIFSIFSGGSKKTLPTPPTPPVPPAPPKPKKKVLILYRKAQGAHALHVNDEVARKISDALYTDEKFRAKYASVEVVTYDDGALSAEIEQKIKESEVVVYDATSLSFFGELLKEKKGVLIEEALIGEAFDVVQLMSEIVKAEKADRDVQRVLVDLTMLDHGIPVSLGDERVILITRSRLRGEKAINKATIINQKKERRNIDPETFNNLLTQFKQRVVNELKGSAEARVVFVDGTLSFSGDYPYLPNFNVDGDDVVFVDRHSLRERSISTGRIYEYHGGFFTAYRRPVVIEYLRQKNIINSEDGAYINIGQAVPLFSSLVYGMNFEEIGGGVVVEKLVEKIKEAL